MNIEIRVANNLDLLEIIKFLSEPEVDNQFVKPLSQRAISIFDRVDNTFNKGIWFLAIKDGVIVACRGVKFPNPKQAKFSTFVVHPKYQKKGIGYQLFIFSIEYIKEKYGNVDIISDSWEGNCKYERILKHVNHIKVDSYFDELKRPQNIKTIVYKFI